MSSTRFLSSLVCAAALLALLSSPAAAASPYAAFNGCWEMQDANSLMITEINLDKKERINYTAPKEKDRSPYVTWGGYEQVTLTGDIARLLAGGEVLNEIKKHDHRIP